jgi:hypothetical protein
MSRITRDRIEPGDALQSSDLNARYSDYTQTDLNAENVTDAAFDTDHMPAEAVLINMDQGTIGVTGDIAHASPGVFNNATSGPATRNVTVNPTLAVGGSSGWTLSTGTVLRVYFNLQCKSELNGANPHQSSIMGAVAIGDPLSPSFDYFSIGAHCWLIQLQWDITSSGLSNFVDVPGAGDFQSVWTASKYGERADNMAGVAAIPAMWAGSLGWYPASGGEAVASTRETRGNGWRNVAGGWVYNGAGQTVYGFRVVIHGVYHPYNDGTNNGLVLETGFTAGQIKFRYSLGNILAMHMRRS